MPAERNARGSRSRKITIDIPERARVVVVGRTRDDAQKLADFLTPWVERKGGALKSFSQLHDMEDLAGERMDVLVLDSSIGSNTREAVEWMVRRSNSQVIVYSFA